MLVNVSKRSVTFKASDRNYEWD